MHEKQVPVFMVLCMAFGIGLGIIGTGYMDSVLWSTVAVLIVGICGIFLGRYLPKPDAVTNDRLLAALNAQAANIITTVDLAKGPMADEDAATRVLSGLQSRVAKLEGVPIEKRPTAPIVGLGEPSAAVVAIPPSPTSAALGALPHANGSNGATKVAPPFREAE